MAAPSTTALGTPAGIHLDEGFKSLIVFARLNDWGIFELESGLPSVQGGDEIDITTQRNTTYTTKAPRTLINIDVFPLTFAYDPDCIPKFISSLCNQNGEFTRHLPDGTTWDFWGYPRDLEFENHQIGEFPTATCNVVITNRDDSGAEFGPVVTEVSGT